ncbi:hypothetical protein SporoP8_07085 [Sporosarcina ureae]|uniref:LlaJI family restriction endonuclease n=1 Tax=Sporosarcina ureae TaxID=1571 RepID=UPI000A16C206|nr:LlaJI family restriction endonuclease [Sporosarcina ureae]ARJ38654.1 hypothetical protein SporoP8_07085 [Sporosarcina ureae]
MKLDSFLYFIEEKQYSLVELRDVLEEDYINQLLKGKICEEISVNSMIKFSFVGLLNYHEKLVFILPKYIDTSNRYDFPKKMKIIIEVIRKYNRKFISGTDFLSFTGRENDKYSISFATAGYILDDYSRNGYYEKKEERMLLNGTGEINWDYTVNEVMPIIINSRPYYLDVITNNESSDRNNIITRIHKWVIANYSSLFGEWIGFADSLVKRENYSLKSLGSKEFLIAKLKAELNETYIDREINLMKVLIQIVEEVFQLASEQLNVYGTKNFEFIWEDVCRTVFNDELEKYKEFIPAPLWSEVGKDLIIEKRTFIPDLIKTYDIKEESYFAVLDAKYYNLRFTSNNVLGNPSINDVSKQLLYQKAFEGITDKKMRNYFLFPHDHDSGNILKVIGKVSLDFINPNPVVLVYLSTSKVYDMYLNNDIIKEEVFELLELQTTTVIYQD